MDETFTLLPIHIDPSSKSLSLRPGTTASSTSSGGDADHALSTQLTKLTALHRSLLSLPSETHATPPAPLPTNPKRSAQIQKMREQGNASLRKAAGASASTTAGGNPAAQEAVKLYTYGIEMALGRPGWEPSALVREETCVLFANRSQAHMSCGQWAEGAADAETSVALKRVGNGKAWWRRGKCLMEMGRWEDARRWVEEGNAVEGGSGSNEGGAPSAGGAGELAGLKKEIDEWYERQEAKSG